MRKSLNFDLDTKKLKEHYPNKNYIEAYNDIKKFLLKNGFEHRQGSGYISEKEISKVKTLDIIKKLNNNHPWLETCCKTFYYSDIRQEYDALLSIKEDKNKTLEVDKIKEKEIKQTYKISNYEPKKVKTNDKDIER